MNRTLTYASALAAGLALSTFAAAQAPAAAAPATPPATTVIQPQALPAKIAIIAFEQAVVATNEGQKTLADIAKKYDPQKTKLEALSKEVDELKKQLQALPATAPDDQRAKLIKDIDTKEKTLQRDGEDASNAYNGEVQEGLAKVASKLGGAAVDYCKKNGFTMLVNVGGNQQTPNPVLWFDESTMDITQAVINAYNVSSGVAAPAPSAPSATRRPTAPAGGATTAPKK